MHGVGSTCCVEARNEVGLVDVELTEIRETALVRCVARLVLLWLLRLAVEIVASQRSGLIGWAMLVERMLLRREMTGRSVRCRVAL